MAKYTHEEFMEKFKNMDSWLYHNTKVIGVYEGIDKHIILDTIYGHIKLLPYELLRGKQQSFTIQSAIDMTSFFIKQVEDLYGEGVFTFANTYYKNAKTNVTITCIRHGDFSINPNVLFKKQSMGCQKCSFEKSTLLKTIPVEVFLNKAVKKHGDKYDYCNLNYKGYKNMITIRCKKCNHIFKQRAGRHIEGMGCPECAKYSQRFSTGEFISKSKLIHGDKYDYSKTVYNGCSKHVAIKCNECNREFISSSNNHLRGSGCPICSKFNIHKRKEWISKAPKRPNFDSYKLYIINVFNEKENFIKIGITSKKIEDRFHNNLKPTSSLPYFYSVIDTIESEDGGYIWDLEKEFHKNFVEFLYAPIIDFGGRYECFSVTSLQLIKEKIEEIRKDDKL